MRNSVNDNALGSLRRLMDPHKLPTTICSCDEQTSAVNVGDLQMRTRRDGGVITIRTAQQSHRVSINKYGGYVGGAKKDEIVLPRNNMDLQEVIA